MTRATIGSPFSNGPERRRMEENDIRATIGSHTSNGPEDEEWRKMILELA